MYSCSEMFSPSSIWSAPARRARSASRSRDSESMSRRFGAASVSGDGVGFVIPLSVPLSRFVREIPKPPARQYHPSGIVSIADPVAGRIAATMRVRGLTQKGLAGLIGAPQSTVQKWVAEGAAPGAALLAKLPAALQVNGHWLLTGEGQVELPGKTPDLELARRIAAEEERARVLRAVGGVASPPAPELAGDPNPADDRVAAVHALGRAPSRKKSAAPAGRRKGSR